jgi:Thrombospondin type 1 domain
MLRSFEPLFPPQKTRMKTDVLKLLVYRWIVDGDWSQCSSSCTDDVGGISTRLVYCVEEMSDGTTQRTLDKLCDQNEKPASQQPCNSNTECPKWVPGAWSPVS